MAFERLTISLQSGVLADTYQIEQLFDEAIGTAHSGTIYGWPMGCTVRAKSFNPASGRYSLSGDYDISEKLKKYIDCTATDAAAIMTTAAGQLGKTALVNIDNHSVKAMTDTTTVMQALSNLFGWTSAIPHQFVNVFQRGDVLHVLQRGKESAGYTLVAYDIKALSYRLLDTLMDESTDSPKIMGDSPDAEDPDDPDSEFFSGAFSFGGATVTYSGGLNTRTVLPASSVSGETTITHQYSGKLPVRTTTEYAGFGTTGDIGYEPPSKEETVYSYGTYDGKPYTSVQETAKSVGGKVQSLSQTNYTPLGFEKYGAHEVSYQHNYDNKGFYSSRTKTADRTYIAEGRPGGEASPWALQNAQKATTSVTPSIDIARNPISSSHIPCTDTTTLQRYADGLTWLDGKTEISLKVDCFDAHIVDFDATVSVMGATWYLQSNSITIGPGAAAKQSLELVRWE